MSNPITETSICTLIDTIEEYSADPGEVLEFFENYATAKNYNTVLAKIKEWDYAN